MKMINLTHPALITVVGVTIYCSTYNLTSWLLESFLQINSFNCI